jgi:PAS domain S-box-containing protein
MHIMTMASHHDPGLVGLSVLIAIMASYAALDLAGRVAAARGRAQATWLTGGALAMGLGIWSMHYVGMLAFNLQIPVFYHVPTVLASLLAAALAAAVALWVVSRRRMTLANAVPGSVVMGLGIGAMHYTGMAAMRLQAVARYDGPLVALSILIAIVVSFVALWLAFHLREHRTRGHRLRKLASAVLMGAAIPSMHYTAMAAVRFTPSVEIVRVSHAIDIPSLGVVAVVGSTFLVLVLAIVTALIDRRLSAQATALESSEQALRDQRQFLLQIVNANPHAIFVKDADGRFTLVNKAMAELYGTTPEGLVGRSDVDLNLDLEEVERFLQDDREVMTSLEPRLIPEEPFTSPASGQTRWFQTVKVPLVAADGRVSQVLGVATDITRRKQLEDQLRQSQKMEAVGRLAGGVAHDFNNLLTAILGHADLLLEETPGEDRRRGDLAGIKGAAERAAGLTRQLLAFSRKQILQPKVLDLNNVVSGVGTLLQRLIGEDIELRITPAPQLGSVEADPGQVEQVILNLAVNARDAMPRGGRLTIETANVELDAAYAREHVAVEPGSYVMLAVSDTGVGMSEEVKAHLFEPFFTTKEQGQGTGLGLATVYGIVKQSGGCIWVYSEPGRGTAFKIYLPRLTACSQVAASAPAHQEADSLAGAGTILLVEDEEAVRRLASRVLAARGYTVLSAANGLQALDTVQRHPGAIDLVITDVVMPQMSGRELAELVRPRRPATKILYVSGYTDDAIVRHGVLDAGVVFLQKPFTPDGLARKVKEILSTN